MTEPLPSSIRYVKNGAGGQWWKIAKAEGQIHAGWSQVPDGLLLERDFGAIKPYIDESWQGKQGATQDFNQLQTLLDRPSQHIWITFEDDCLWWCKVADEVVTCPTGETKSHGHFWLSCTMPWSNYSLGGLRHLAKSVLPGSVTSVAGFRGTVCEPRAAVQILRIIRNEDDADVLAARIARDAYRNAIANLIKQLGPKDFELLVDLILARTGWNRLAKIGGARADIDIEAENAAIDEIAFVQVKSTGSQATLDEYYSTFLASSRYQRMIFAVHSPEGQLRRPDDHKVQIWDNPKIADLAVKHGLGDWVSARL